MGRTLTAAFRDAFFRDVQVWQHKSRIDNPILSQHDGLIYQLRRWYEQYYADVGDIEKDMVARKEVEVDMTKPLAARETEQARPK